ncbi:hypothetical protein DB32_007173 [Sandaracinus amylolyticus]|uniref:Uncharacterized protein n=1 Tax=Sandaracinus amylolyticus TaxID=927083 RepID=A0A0F6SH89_9BACT|nr:hypothetical protein DB32_007173 [Sandaracinus amylolyticus]
MSGAETFDAFLDELREDGAGSRVGLERRDEAVQLRINVSITAICEELMQAIELLECVGEVAHSSPIDSAMEP